MLNGLVLAFLDNFTSTDGNGTAAQYINLVSQYSVDLKDIMPEELFHLRSHLVVIMSEGKEEAHDLEDIYPKINIFVRIE